MEGKVDMGLERLLSFPPLEPHFFEDCYGARSFANPKSRPPSRFSLIFGAHVNVLFIVKVNIIMNVENIHRWWKKEPTRPWLLSGNQMKLHLFHTLARKCCHSSCTPLIKAF